MGCSNKANKKKRVFCLSPDSDMIDSPGKRSNNNTDKLTEQLSSSYIQQPMMMTSNTSPSTTIPVINGYVQPSQTPIIPTLNMAMNSPTVHTMNGYVLSTPAPVIANQCVTGVYMQPTPMIPVTASSPVPGQY